MNRIIILCIGFIALNSHLSGIKAPLKDWFAFPTENADSLPTVLAKNHSDLIAGKLRFDAVIKFGVNQFPAVINTVGHWPKSKIDSTGQHAVGQSLALNGYGCLTIDPRDPVKGLLFMAYLK